MIDMSSESNLLPEPWLFQYVPHWWHWIPQTNTPEEEVQLLKIYKNVGKSNDEGAEGFDVQKNSRRQLFSVAS